MRCNAIPCPGPPACALKRQVTNRNALQSVAPQKTMTLKRRWEAAKGKKALVFSW